MSISQAPETSTSYTNKTENSTLETT
jgi:hypothetical protein